MDKELKKMFDKVKIGLMMKGSIFLSTITFSVKHVFTEDLPTAGTDGLSIMYNPDFFKALTVKERIGLLAHETWHIALSHMLRIGDRDKILFNMAGDYVINLMLDKAGFTLPKEALLDNKYRDWSTIQVYDDLVLNKKKPPENYQPDIIELEDSPGNDPGDKDKSGNTQLAQTNVSKKELEETIKNILVKAATQSKMQKDEPGSIPGEVERMIDELINPKLDYTELLRRFMDSHIKDDYSWGRPNRRYLPDFYLPSQNSEALSSLTIAIDTSGSITDDDMLKMLSEINHIYEHYKPEILTILDCDWEIHNIHEVTRDSNIEITQLRFSGGGGTSFKPVIDYCKEHETKVLVYFTDLYASPVKEDPGFPIVWLCYSDHEPAKIGETVYYDP